MRDELRKFTGDHWVQEDDITLVTLEYTNAVASSGLETPMSFTPANTGWPDAGDDNDGSEQHTMDDWQTLVECEIPSAEGNERLAMEEVATALASIALPNRQLERLKTAVAEATMNAIEHGNHFRADQPVAIQVLASSNAVAVRISDNGGEQVIGEPELPDIDLKLDGLQSPRGWGLFLMKSLVDELHVTSDQQHHIIELVLYLKGEMRENA